MKITREDSGWNYPCFGKAQDGDVVWFTSEGTGSLIIGSYANGFGWNMGFFTPIDNPFEKKVEKFNPITIVLETEEDAINMYQTMIEAKLIDYEDTTKLGKLLC